MTTRGSGAGVIELDVSARVRAMNRAGQRITGVKLDQADGRPIHDALQDPALLSLVLYALISEKPVEADVQQGRRRIRVRSEDIMDEAGQATGTRLLLSEVDS